MAGPETMNGLPETLAWTGLPALQSAFHSALTPAELFGLFAHFLMLSMLAIGGAITTAPDMHRYVVTQQHWITDTQFTTSIAIAQAAPGPNVLFVAVIGWNVAGPLGALATMTGVLLPSTVLALSFARWSAQRRESRGIQAFTAGLAPLTLGLLLATGWVLAEPFVRDPSHRYGTLALLALSVGLAMGTRLGPLWLVGLGALAGIAGIV
jgi:chromate transporter